MNAFPTTPDFDVWPVTHAITQAEAKGASLQVTWDDGKACDYHVFFLRENSPDDATIHPLLQHMDMPTRECPHGLQFLCCRKNTAKGEQGLYCDGYRIAEDMRTQEPEHFHSLTTDIWEHNNRAKTSSYRARGPIVDIDRAGRSGIIF